MIKQGITILILSLILVACEEPPKEWDPAWTQCAEQGNEGMESQCRTVKGVCGWESINRQHYDKVKAYYSYIAPLTDCPSEPQFLIPSPASRCVDGKCIFQGYNK